MNILINSFPRSLISEVAKIMLLLKNCTIVTKNRASISNDNIVFNLKEESIIIPSRIYYQELDESVLNKLNDIEKKIIYCIYTRSYDGYVRQKYLNKIFELENIEEWMFPFIIKLCDEYIIEIIGIIYNGFSKISNLKEAFIENNQTYMNLLYNRIISYWDFYYRSEFPELKTYIGYKLYEKIIKIADN